MADITINDLTEITEVTDSHYLAVDDGTASNKISVENFNATATASAAAYASAAADSATAAAESETKAKGYKETVEQAINDASTIVSNAQTYANNAESSKNDASGYASDASTAATQAANSATLAAGYATNVNAYVTEAKSFAEGGTGTRVGEDQDNAKYYSQAAHTSETNAAASESNASTSETNAAASESNAATSESNASGYASSASADALKAEGYAVGKQNGVDVTSGQTYYHDNAKYYKEEAATSASNASTSETNAGLSESAAAGSASAADDSAEDSEAWAVGTRDGDPVPSSDPAYHNNAKYWADVAAGGVSGVSSFNGRSGNVVPQSGDYAANIIEYVNTTSGLTATTAQGAIDEVYGAVGTLDSSLATVAKTGAYSDLSGKPTLGTASAKDVPTTGNASTTQVVMGDDSRLTDSRTPTSHTHTKSDITDFPSLGTAAAKNSTNAVTQSSTDLVESGAVYSEVSSLNSALSNKVNTSDIANNLTTTTTGKVLDATQGKALADKHKVTSFQVSTSSWSSDTTSQSGTTLYKKSVALSHVYADSPSVDIGATSGSVLPTTAQQTAYDLLQYVTCDSAVPCLYLYASAIPTDTFYINVEGVD